MTALRVVPWTAYTDAFLSEKQKQDKKITIKKQTLASPVPLPPPPTSPWVHGQFKEMQRFGEILCRYPLQGYRECEVPGPANGVAPSWIIAVEVSHATSLTRRLARAAPGSAQVRDNDNVLNVLYHFLVIELLTAGPGERERREERPRDAEGERGRGRGGVRTLRVALAFPSSRLPATDRQAFAATEMSSVSHAAAPWTSGSWGFLCFRMSKSFVWMNFFLTLRGLYFFAPACDLLEL